MCTNSEEGLASDFLGHFMSSSSSVWAPHAALHVASIASVSHSTRFFFDACLCLFVDPAPEDNGPGASDEGDQEPQDVADEGAQE